MNLSNSFLTPSTLVMIVTFHGNEFHQLIMCWVKEYFRCSCQSISLDDPMYFMTARYKMSTPFFLHMHYSLVMGLLYLIRFWSKSGVLRQRNSERRNKSLPLILMSYFPWRSNFSSTSQLSIWVPGPLNSVFLHQSLQTLNAVILPQPVCPHTFQLNHSFRPS